MFNYDGTATNYVFHKASSSSQYMIVTFSGNTVRFYGKEQPLLNDNHVSKRYYYIAIG